MKPHDSRIIRVLNQLYQECLQKEAAYRRAFQEARDSDLRYLFGSYSIQSGKLARELGVALAVMGVVLEVVPPEEPPEPVADRSSRALLADLARGEESAVLLYREALIADLTRSLRSLLERQLGESEAMRDRLGQLHSLAKPDLAADENSAA